jgi:hypothetical protein
METRSYPLTDFRLAEFLAAYTEFYQWWSSSDEDGSVAVCLLDRLGEIPMPSNEQRDLRAELVEHGRLVFFPFHEPITGDEVKCLDGSVYVDDEEDPRLDIGVADIYGCLFEVCEGQVTIRGALCEASSGPVPTLEIVDECGVFDERMGAYVRRFVGPA